MKMADTEEYFPRGGKKPTVKHFKQSSNFLGAVDQVEKKKKRPRKTKKSEGDDGYLSDDVHSELDTAVRTCANGLNYKIVKEGVLILARVTQVLETKVHVSLPCRMQGSVMACHISEAYNKLLEAYVEDKVSSVRELRSMFRAGQYLAVRVLETNAGGAGGEGATGRGGLLLSAMPQHVHAGLTHKELHKGTLLQAAVSSVEDHGYVMDLGVPNTRAFLPKKNSNDEIELDTGSLTWVVVKGSVPSAADSVVTLSAQPAALQAAVSRRPRPLVPGTAVEFVVDKPLENGIEGRLPDGSTAYIQRQHTDKVKGKKPTLGQKIKAHLLYNMPTVKTPFLTMKGIFDTTWPDPQAEQEFEMGDFVDGQVIKITGRSVLLKLSKRSFATLSARDVRGDERTSDQEAVAKKYPVGSTVRARVLHHHALDATYVVSDAPAALAERVLGLRQLAPGQRVEGTVSAVDGGLSVAVGRVTGFVPHAHLSDAGVCGDQSKAAGKHALTLKYKVGQKVSARVLKVDPETRGLLLTLKPSLLAEDLPLLTSYEDARVGGSYTGVVKYIKDFLLVSFFNDVVAYVPRQFVARQPLARVADAFHVGQIVTCTVLDVQPAARRMSASLTTPPFDPEEKRKKRTKDKSEKKRKLDANAETDTKIESETEHTPPKKKKKERNKKSSKESEESDAIETDFKDEEVLSEREKSLVDLSACQTRPECKRRVMSLLTAVNARTRRHAIVAKKIDRIERAGLNSKNKKFHTAMHAEKLLLQDTITALMDALKEAQAKLKDLSEEQEENEAEKEAKKVKKVQKELEGRVRRLRVQDEPAEPLDAPSARDFWAGAAGAGGAGEREEAMEAEEESSSSDEEAPQPKKKRVKLTGAQKTALLREDEARLRAREAAAGAAGAGAAAAGARSADGLARALLATPGDSRKWIEFMAFYLQATEIDKARGVARKALATIPFRQEDDKLNVWLALVNLEIRFGTQESQQKTIDEALQMNDTYKVHCALLEAYADAGRPAELQALVDVMLRRYRTAECFARAGAACYRLGLLEKARRVMQRAVGALEKKEHVSLLVQFARLERGAGERERAEALFEQLLSSYPARVDVAAAYADMLVKGGDGEMVRQVMDRLTAQKLPARKMKILYKKWIEVEEKLGDEEQVEKIRQKAAEYIENAKF